jgi:hypothetical protein
MLPPALGVFTPLDDDRNLHTYSYSSQHPEMNSKVSVKNRQAFSGCIGFFGCFTER